MRGNVAGRPASAARITGTRATYDTPGASHDTTTASSAHHAHTPLHNPQNPARRTKNTPFATTTAAPSAQNAISNGSG